MKLSIRGMRFTGEVVSDRGRKTVVVERKIVKKLPKYERYIVVRSKILAHNEIGAKVGDIVEIAETRKISRRKSFVVTKVIKRAEERRGG